MKRETSQVLARTFASLRQQGIGSAEISGAVKISVEELNRHVFGLVLTSHDGSDVHDGSLPVRPPLRIPLPA